MKIILAAGTQERWNTNWQFDNMPPEISRPKQLLVFNKENLLTRANRLFPGPGLIVASSKLMGFRNLFPRGVAVLEMADSPGIVHSMLGGLEYAAWVGGTYVLCGDVWWSENLAKAVPYHEDIHFYLNGSEIFGIYCGTPTGLRDLIHASHKAIKAKHDAKLWDVYYEIHGHHEKGHHPPPRDQWIPEGDLTTDIDFAVQYEILKRQRNEL